MARRRHSNRRRRRGNFGFLYKLLSVLVICAAVVMALTLFFRVDTIEVTGTERYTEKDVIEASGIQLGDNLFLLNKYEAARSIAEQLPYIDIEDIRIRRELPDTLLIDVAECGTPLAVIQDGSAWLLSPKGKIVEQLPASQAGDYAVIDGCELLAPSVGTDIALSTEFANQQTSLLALLAALGWILYSAHQDGWPPPEDPQITGVYFYDAAGQEIAKSDFGWYLFPPDSTVNVAVTFQDGREHTVDQVVLFLYPTGTGVAEERQQIGVRRIRDGRTFALFRWQIPASLYSHLEVQLECGDGQTISVSQWNVIDRDSAF